MSSWGWVSRGPAHPPSQVRSAWRWQVLYGWVPWGPPEGPYGRKDGPCGTYESSFLPEPSLLTGIRRGLDCLCLVDRVSVRTPIQVVWQGFETKFECLFSARGTQTVPLALVPLGRLLGPSSWSPGYWCLFCGSGSQWEHCKAPAS